MNTIPSIPRESKELYPVSVTLSGGAVVSNVELCVLPDRTRPVDANYLPAVNVGGALFVLVNPVTDAGLYQVFARVTTASEKPVVIGGILYRS